jgi:hypothetical protein
MLISETRLQILQVQKQFQEEVAGKLRNEHEIT